jgi:uncharacterized protein
MPDTIFFGSVPAINQDFVAAKFLTLHQPGRSALIPRMVQSQSLTFHNHNTRLAGTLFLPEGSGPFPALLVLHAAQGGLRSYPFYQHLAVELPQHGFAVFLFDRRGCGESQGDFESTSFNLLAEDGAAAFDCLQNRPTIDPQRIGLYGISQGGWIVPLTAAMRPEAAFLVAVSSSGVSPADQMDYAARYNLQRRNFDVNDIEQALRLRGQINEYYRGKVSRSVVQEQIDQSKLLPWFDAAYLSGDTLLPDDVTCEKWTLEMDHDPLAPWLAVKQSSLFLFGYQDEWVPVEESVSRFKTVTQNLKDVRMVVFPGVDHLMGETDSLGTPRISLKYLITLLDWLNEENDESA